MKIPYDQEKLWIKHLQSESYTISSTPFTEPGYKLVYVKRKNKNVPKLSKILKIKLPENGVGDFIKELKRKAR